METSAHEVSWIILYPLYAGVIQWLEASSDTRVVGGPNPPTSTIICGVGREADCTALLTRRPLLVPRFESLTPRQLHYLRRNTTMYFIVRYNWIDCKLTNKCSVGFFRSLKKAKKFISLYLNQKDSRNTIAIVRINQGHKTYNFPLVVY